MKLYFENTVTTVTTLMVLSLVGFVGYSISKRNSINFWGSNYNYCNNSDTNCKVTAYA